MVRILPLRGHHDRKSFDCGNADLNRWLATMARQHMDKGISSTFVATDTETSPAVYGFYSVSIGELRSAEFSASKAKKYPQRILLANAIERLTETAAIVGGMGILVDSKPSALPFYQRYGFEPLADDHPLELFLPLSRS